MKRGTHMQQLKEIKQNILKGISLKDDFEDIKTIVGFDLAFKGQKILCAAVVLDYETFEVLETTDIEIEEPMPYSPQMICFREGPAIIEAYKNLETKPDILILDGNGSINPKVIGVANYVGVLTNKPCIGVSSKLVSGRLDVDNVIYDDKLTGKALKSKDFANPIYVSPGHKVSLESATEIIKKCLKGHKMPEPIHLAHSKAVKLKKRQ